jgi:hypothetical protein
MNLHTSYSPTPRSFGAMHPATRPSAPAIESVVLRHLRSPAEIEAILHLRDEIDLSAHNSAGSNFLSLEKKEMSSASFVRSSSTGTS